VSLQQDTTTDTALQAYRYAHRSGLVDGQRISLFAGCGIVRDSEAQQEWRETELKMRPMMSALGLT
jgi:menaquinone-specific isochorismate synthase